MDYLAVEANLRESFRILARGTPHGEILELDGVTIASAGVRFQMFNAAFLSGPSGSEDELHRRLGAARAHFRSRGQEWSAWLCEDLIDLKTRRKLPAVCRRLGLFRATELPGMMARSIEPPRRPLPPIEIRRVRSAAEALPFCAVGSTCFHVPLGWFREVFDGPTDWDGFASYVGYVDGEAVATAAAVPGAGTIGIYNVATLPKHQRKGYGEAMMRHALAEAGSGAPSILQATPQGFELYMRMGYRTVAQFSVYAS